MRNPFAKPKRVAERDCHAYPFADAERDGDALPPADPYPLSLADGLGYTLAVRDAFAVTDAVAERQSICHTVSSPVHGTFAVHGPLSYAGEHFYPCTIRATHPAAD